MTYLSIKFDLMRIIADTLPHEEFGIFHFWAFGSHPTSMNVADLMKRWNDLHGQCLWLNEDCIPELDAKIMLDLWHLENSQFPQNEKEMK